MIRIYLSKNKIDSIILEDFNKNVFDEIIKLVNESKFPEFNEVFELINTKEKLENLVLLDTYDKLVSFDNIYASIIERIKSRIDIETFNEKEKKISDKFIELYSKFSNRKAAYMVLKELNIRVCPYCNRMYTFSIKSKNGKTRPEFDHFIPKEKCPLLALSIYNLIPSCSICNKGKSKKYPHDILYPYESSFDEQGIYFELQDTIKYLLDKKTSSKIVKLTSEDSSSEKIINSYNSLFKIEELYNEHSDFIVDLIKKRQIFNDDMIDSVYSSFDELFDSRDDVKEILLGYSTDNDYTKRPLSKLTNDVLKQLE
jgi:5-methylcytosine-specific restriction endonuclease McrA